MSNKSIYTLLCMVFEGFKVELTYYSVYKLDIMKFKVGSQKRAPTNSTRNI